MLNELLFSISSRFSTIKTFKKNNYEKLQPTILPSTKISFASRFSSVHCDNHIYFKVEGKQVGLTMGCNERSGGGRQRGNKEATTIRIFILFATTVFATGNQFSGDLNNLLNSASEKMNVEQYRLLDAHDVFQKLAMWRNEYPNLIQVETAQESYGLPRAGTAKDCPHDVGVTGCSNYFFTIQDFIAHPEGSESSAQLPEVFWSGSLHGDERLGPTVVMESAALLLEAATCEARPSLTAKSFEHEVIEAKLCRSQLKERGIDDERRRWLSRLVSTRRIVVVPNANALGFYRDQHGEDLVDPDEDFAYDQEFSESCMQTIAARTINEIFREHIFQLALSFHSGGGGIGYSWGSPSWLEAISPDNRSQNQVAEAYSTVAGGWSRYKFGQITDEFDNRKGATEDWAYAASWDSTRVRPCNPETFGGYSEEKTTYNNSTNRAITMLVSANTKTSQSDSDLGSSLDLFQRDREMDEFHVASNMRLAFVSADLVEPYVSVFGIDNLPLSDDIVPLTERSGRSCKRTKAIAVPFGQDKMIVEWTVGGAIHISETDLWYAKWDDIPEEHLDCLLQPNSMDGFSRAQSMGNTNGTAFFSHAGPSPHPNESFIKPGKTLGPVFRAQINARDFKVGDKIVLIARARVDQGWMDAPLGDFEPKRGPQSHLTNARTNPDWNHEHEGKKVQGRLDWYSVPVTIVVDDFDYRIGSLELYNRYGPELHFGTGGSSLSKPSTYSAADIFWQFLAGVAVFIMMLFCTVRVVTLRAENAKMESIMHAEMFAMRKQSECVARPCYVEAHEDNVYGPDSDEEFIDFQA
jgi:hypothetical protein